LVVFEYLRHQNRKAEDRNYGLIPEIKKIIRHAKIVLTGCLAERKDVKRRLSKTVDIWLPIKKSSRFYRELGLKKKKSSKKDYLDISR